MEFRKGSPVALISGFCVIAMFSAAVAQDDTAGTSSTVYEHGNFGIGVIFGEPSGLSAKMWTTENTGFDLGLAWSFSGDGNFHIHGDYLFHKFGLFDITEGSLPLYVGIGGRIRFEDDSRVGVRFPIGLEYYFDDWPIAIFGEVVPILDVAPSTEGDINGGLGIRFYF